MLRDFCDLFLLVPTGCIDQIREPTATPAARGRSASLPSLTLPPPCRPTPLAATSLAATLVLALLIALSALGSRPLRRSPPARRSDGYDAAASDESVLTHSQALYSAALAGKDDIMVGRYVAACRHYANHVLPRLISGPALAGGVSEIHSNADKIAKSTALAELRRGSTKGTAERTSGDGGDVLLRDLLVAEASTGIHGLPDAVLADQSAAMGALWSRRGINMHAKYYELLVGNPECRNDAGATMRAAFEASHARYVGWFGRSSFGLATRSMHGWNRLCQRPRIGSADGVGDEDIMRGWTSMAFEVVRRMRETQAALNLEDTRKSI